MDEDTVLEIAGEGGVGVGVDDCCSGSFSGDAVALTGLKWRCGTFETPEASVGTEKGRRDGWVSSTARKGDCMIGEWSRVLEMKMFEGLAFEKRSGEDGIGV